MIKNLITAVMVASMPILATTQNINTTYTLEKNINAQWYSDDGSNENLIRVTTESALQADDYGMLQYKAIEFYHGSYDELENENVIDIKNYTFYNKISLYKYTPYERNGYNRALNITLTETLQHPNMNMSEDLLLNYKNQVYYVTDDNWDTFISIRNNEITWERYEYFLKMVDYDLYKILHQQKNETREVAEWTDQQINIEINTNKKYYATVVLERYNTDETETTKPVYANKPIMETSSDSILATLQFNISENQTIVKQEVIDLPSLLFTILSMPFSFVSQAFNLTLFPNTPYSIDIGNIFLALIGTLVLVFVIGLIAKKAK